MVGVGGSPGGFAEYVRVHQRETVGLPEHIDHTLGALVEPLAVGLHAVERAHIRSGDKVLVVGAGPVGLSVITWAARSGAGELVVSDPSAVRREAAAQFGATRTVDPEAEPLEARYDVVIECVGLPGHDRRVRRRRRPPRARRDRRRVHQARSLRADHGPHEGAHHGLRRVLHATRVLRRRSTRSRTTPSTRLRSSPSGSGSTVPTTRSRAHRSQGPAQDPRAALRVRVRAAPPSRSPAPAPSRARRGRRPRARGRPAVGRPRRAPR